MTTVPHALGAGNQLAIVAPHWLGDAVMSLPSVADVRRTFASVRLTVIARPPIAPLFTLVPGIDDVVTLDDRERTAVNEIKSRRFDAVLLLPNSFHSALTAWRAGIPERWGYRADCRGALLTRSVTRPYGLHQAAYYQALVAGLGVVNGPLLPQVAVPDDVRRRGQMLLTERGWDGRAPLVAVAPGAANGRAKQWPPASFASVVTSLASEGVTIVLVGTPGDSGAAAEVVSNLDAPARARVVDLVGRTDLATLAGVLVHCKSLVTNDSGGMHFAAALGVSLTAMFGPSRENETRPLGTAPTHVLTHSVWCRPCMLRDCPIDHRCMTGITPESVLTTVETTITAEAAERAE